MLKRKILQQLITWKDKENKQTLIIEGARQVGKTFIINHFASQYYGEKVLRINFLEDESAQSIFAGDLSFETIHNNLQVKFNINGSIGKETLVFFDEIQECPRAISALKGITIANQFDCIVSGSLLGVNYQNVKSFPVGYVERITLLPLDFEEFLWALNNEILLEKIQNAYITRKELTDFEHQEAIKAFRLFAVVGGMPEVINAYKESNNLQKVMSTQLKILNDYKSDIAKYAMKNEKAKAREVFDSIPVQLGKEYRKFQYKYVSKNARSSSYDGSIQWLIDSGIIYKCNNITTPQIPLSIYKKVDEFKLYLVDSGLFVGMLGPIAQQDLILNTLGIAKGAIFENLIATCLRHMNLPLYYYSRNNTLEIDFMLESQEGVFALEVKSSDNTKAKSLKTLISDNEVSFGLKLSAAKTINLKDSIKQIPLYMVMCINH